MRIGEYVVGWQYGHKDHPVGKKTDESRSFTVQQTTCNIFTFKPGDNLGDKSERNLIASATIGRFSTDRDDKELARKKSLTRALTNFTNNYAAHWDADEQRKFRTKVWAAYFGSKPEKAFVVIKGRGPQRKYALSEALAKTLDSSNAVQ